MVSVENIHIIQHNTDLYWKEVNLRYNILRKPLGIDFNPEQLAAEEVDTHIVYAIDDEVFGCMVLTKINDQVLKMRQVAVDDKVQGVGIGALMVQYAEDYARTQGYLILTCNARDTAVSFYVKQGWQKVGEEFFEVGIPHYKLERSLA